MTYIYSDFLIIQLDLVSCSTLEHDNTYFYFRHSPFDATTTSGGVCHPLFIQHSPFPCAKQQVPLSILYQPGKDPLPSGGPGNPQAKQHRVELLLQDAFEATNLRPLI